MYQEELLKKITEHFGIETELTKLNEEIGELLNECYREHFISNGKSNIEDEFADVMVVLVQILLYFDLDADKINDIFDEKVDRTVKRIDDGWYDKHR